MIKRIPALILAVLLILTMIPLLPGTASEAHADSLTGNAYAVVSEDGKTLTFIRSTQDIPDNTYAAKGNPIKSVTATDGHSYTGRVYAGIETIKYGLDTKDNRTVGPQWLAAGYFTTITSVKFTDTIRPLSTYSWFSRMKQLTSIEGLEKLDTSSVTYMLRMFSDSSSLTSLDLSSFDTSKVTDMEYMFSGCTDLTSLDLSSFDTSKVRNMTSMFSGCSSLTSLDLSGFDTSEAASMGAMFAYCSSLTDLDLSSFDTRKVIGMWSMFYGCSSLTSLDLSSFDTSRVTGMGYMFSGCSALTSLDLSNFDTSNTTVMKRMFADCSALTGLDLSGFDTYNVTNQEWMLDGTCSDNETGTPYKGYAPSVSTAISYNCVCSSDTAKLEFTEKSSFYVYLHYNDGKTAAKRLERKKGESLSLPVPSREGYVFDGWYTVTKDTPKYKSEYKRAAEVDPDIIGTQHYYAEWHAGRTVKFDTNGGGTISAQTVDINDSAEKPDDPVKDGYIFDGWYTDKDCTSAYDFSTPVTEDMTLYAKWTPTPATNIADSVNELETTKGDQDPAGSKFAPLKLRYDKIGNTSTTLKWTKVKGAAKYVIFANKCGSQYKKLSATTASGKKVTKVNGKKLKKGTYYKYFVAAFDKDGRQIAVSRTIHVATAGGKVGNYRSVKVTNVTGGKKSLKQGASFKLKAEPVKQSGKLKVKVHRGLRYESSNTKIATVSSKGVIKAKAKGACCVYVYAQSGKYAKVNVTVK
ncbi:MAG: BspA family leucine-rich repeat surface protein [Anaerovoracaceae bacterium]